jgi:hypothetical protein
MPVIFGDMRQGESLLIARELFAGRNVGILRDALLPLGDERQDEIEDHWKLWHNDWLFDALAVPQPYFVIAIVQGKIEPIATRPRCEAVRARSNSKLARAYSIRFFLPLVPLSPHCFPQAGRHERSVSAAVFA